MNAKKFLVSGVVGGLVIFVVWMIVGVLVQALRLYDVMSLGGMRSVNDPIMMLFFLHPWVISFAMALLYSQLGGALGGSVVRRGVKLGLLMWVVSSIPSVFIVYTSMNYPLVFSVVSVAGSLAYMAASGVVIARIAGDSK